MTKEVLVNISGLQYELEDNEALEVITPGDYYCKGDKHYILYEEVLEENNAVTKNTIKITDTGVDLLRKGSVNVHMSFEEGRNNIAYYNTPFGQLLVGLNTYKIEKEIQDSYIKVCISYGLDVNYSHVSDCKIHILIQSKDMDHLEIDHMMNSMIGSEYKDDSMGESVTG